MPDGSVSPPPSPPLQISSGTAGGTPQSDPLRDVIAKLSQVVSQGQLALADPTLARTVGKLVEQSNEPERLEQGSFRTGVAYAVQDLEKLPAISVTMPAALRAEMTELAATSPGLQNERMQALVAKTPELTERGLIEDIRRAAYQTARSGAEQDTPELRTRIEALEKRAGVTPAAPSVNSTEPPPHPGPDKVTSAGPDRPANETPTTVQPQPAKPEAGTPAKAADAPSSKEKVIATPSPGSGQTSVAPSTEPTTPAAKAAVEPAAQTNGASKASEIAANQSQSAGRVVVGPGQTSAEQLAEAAGVLAGAATSIAQAATAAAKAPNQPRRQTVGEGIMALMRKPQPSTPPPWSAAAPPVGPRLAQMEQQVGDTKMERLVQAAEKSGASLNAALDQFTSGPARGVLAKLENAAAKDAGGMPAVIAGMKPDGPYAAERAEFIGALRNPAIADPYNTVINRAAKHAEARVAVEDTLRKRGLDPAVLGDRLEKKDAELAGKAANIPGREPGKNALEEMAQKLADLLKKAVEKVGQVIDKVAGAGVQAQTRPGPSPSPGM